MLSFIPGLLYINESTESFFLNDMQSLVSSPFLSFLGFCVALLIFILNRLFSVFVVVDLSKVSLRSHIAIASIRAVTHLVPASTDVLLFVLLLTFL